MARSVSVVSRSTTSLAEPCVWVWTRSSAAIASGEFVATVPVGRVRIEFSAPNPMGKQKMYDTADNEWMTEGVPYAGK